MNRKFQLVTLLVAFSLLTPGIALCQKKKNPKTSRPRVVQAGEPSGQASPGAAPGGAVSSTGKLALSGGHLGLEGILTIHADATLTGPFRISVTDAGGATVGKPLDVELKRNETEHSEKIALAKGRNAITVTDLNAPDTETASLQWVGKETSAAAAGAAAAAAGAAVAVVADEVEGKSPSKKLLISGAHKNDKGILVVKADPTLTGPLNIVVKDEKDKPVGKPIKIKLERGVNEYREDLSLANGENTITVTDESAPAETATMKWASEGATTAKKTPLPMPGSISPIEEGDTRVSGRAEKDAIVQIIVNDAPFKDTVQADGEGNFIYHLRSNQELKGGDEVSARQKRKDDTDENYSSTRPVVTVSEIAQRVPLQSGSPIGYLLGGTIISQQAQEFQQVDPFFGFVAGYRFGSKNSMVTFPLVDEMGHLLLENGKPTTRRFRVDKYGYPINDKNQLLKQLHVAVVVGGGVVAEMGVVVSTKENVNGEKLSEAQIGEPLLVLDAAGVPITRTPSFGGRNSFSRLLYGGGQYQILFKGIFESAGRTAEQKPAASASPTPTPTPVTGASAVNFAPFIASRKTFDVDMTISYNFPGFARWFDIGPYVTIGASSVLSKKELQGEAVAVNDTTQPTNTGTQATIDAGQAAQSDNDIKQYREFGVQSTVRLFNSKLFMQSMLAYGNYEALDGLYPGHNTKHRFVGHLRIIPSGLNLDFGGQRSFAPIFGVDVNAGRGPDQLKFFTGFVIKIKGLQ